MREIKFKFFDSINKTMSEIKELEHLPARYKKKQYIPRQYSGRKDQSGIEIYVGDIISFYNIKNGSYTKKTFPVIFKDCNFVAGNENINYWLGSKSLYRIEIVGNIYENSEFLKEIDK